MYRFAAAMLATLVAVGVVVVCAMQIATPSRSERVLDALPDAVVGDYAPSGWALAEGVVKAWRVRIISSPVCSRSISTSSRSGMKFCLATRKVRRM